MASHRVTLTYLSPLVSLTDNHVTIEHCQSLLSVEEHLALMTVLSVSIRSTRTYNERQHGYQLLQELAGRFVSSSQPVATRSIGSSVILSLLHIKRDRGVADGIRYTRRKEPAVMHCEGRREAVMSSHVLGSHPRLGLRSKKYSNSDPASRPCHCQQAFLWHRICHLLFASQCGIGACLPASP